MRHLPWRLPLSAALVLLFSALGSGAALASPSESEAEADPHEAVVPVEAVGSEHEVPAEVAPAEPLPAQAPPAEPLPAEPLPAEPLPAEPLPAAPAHAEPAPHTEPADVEPVHTEPVHTEPVHTEPVHTEPVHTEPAHIEPADAEPAPQAPVQPTTTPPQDVASASADATPHRKAPLRRARGVLLQVVLGVALLALVQRIGLRLRQRYPRLQDDLLVGQFVVVTVVLVVTLLAALRALQGVSWQLVSAVIIALTAGVAFLVLRALPNYLDGLWIMLGPTLRVGDHLVLGDVSGILSEIGLVRMTITRHDGTRHSLPVSALGGRALSIMRRDHSHPLVMTLPAGAEPLEARDAVWTAAMMSPYRDADAPVDVELEHPDPARGAGEAESTVLRVAMVVWSPEVAKAAETHLRASLVRRLQERQGSGQP